MLQRLVSIFFCGLFTASAAKADEKLSYFIQGISRTATVHVPTSSGHPSPLVIALHGLGDRGEDFQRWSGVDSVAEREGFVTVYPDAIEGKWAYGRPIIAPMPIVDGRIVADVVFIETLIDDLITRQIADSRRIYITGMSRGALMAFTLGCTLSDKIAAIAPVASPMTDHQVEDCKPKHALSVLMVNGTSDESQFYDGFLFPEGRLLLVPETLEYWRKASGCTAIIRKPLPHLNKSDPTRTSEYNWQECKSGSAIRSYRIENGGHRWPLLQHGEVGDPMKSDRFGNSSRDLDTPTELWNFFNNKVN